MPGTSRTQSHIVPTVGVFDGTRSFLHANPLHAGWSAAVNSQASLGFTAEGRGLTLGRLQVEAPHRLMPVNGAPVLLNLDNWAAAYERAAPPLAPPAATSQRRADLVKLVDEKVSNRLVNRRSSQTCCLKSAYHFSQKRTPSTRSEHFLVGACMLKCWSDQVSRNLVA